MNWTQPLCLQPLYVERRQKCKKITLKHPELEVEWNDIAKESVNCNSHQATQP